MEYIGNAIHLPALIPALKFVGLILHYSALRRLRKDGAQSSMKPPYYHTLPLAAFSTKWIAATTTAAKKTSGMVVRRYGHRVLTPQTTRQ